MSLVRLTFALVLVAPALGGGAGISAQDAAREDLSTQFQLTTADFRALDQRRPVARTLETVDGREVATFGAIRMRVPSTYYVEQLRDIVGFKVGEAVLQIGAFSSPARVEDMSRLSLDARDVESLRGCRPGGCRSIVRGSMRSAASGAASSARSCDRERVRRWGPALSRRGTWWRGDSRRSKRRADD